MSVNLQQLYYFHKLAQVQHYTKAAKLLYITQPSLSKAIRVLENSLDVELFEKDGRNVRLTEQGMEFYKHVDIAFSEIQKGLDKLDEYKGVLRGSINIAAVPTLLSSVIPEIVSGFNDHTNRQVETHIFQGFSNSIIDGVIAGVYDVGFCHVPADYPGLKRHKVMSQYLRLAVPAGHQLAERSCVSLRDLTGKRVLSYRTNNFIGMDTENLVRPYHLNVELNYDDEIILTALVAQKGRLALCLDVPDIRNNPSIRLIPIEEALEDFHPIYIICSETPKTYAQKKFIAYVKAMTNLPVE